MKVLNYFEICKGQFDIHKDFINFICLPLINHDEVILLFTQEDIILNIPKKVVKKQFKDIETLKNLVNSYYSFYSDKNFYIIQTKNIYQFIFD